MHCFNCTPQILIYCIFVQFKILISLEICLFNCINYVEVYWLISKLLTVFLLLFSNLIPLWSEIYILILFFQNCNFFMMQDMVYLDKCLMCTWKGCTFCGCWLLSFFKCQFISVVGGIAHFFYILLDFLSSSSIDDWERNIDFSIYN